MLEGPPEGSAHGSKGQPASDMKFDFAMRPLRVFASFPHPVCVSFQPLSSSALPPNLTSTLKSWLINAPAPPSQNDQNNCHQDLAEYSEKRTLKFFLSLHTLILEEKVSQIVQSRNTRSSS